MSRISRLLSTVMSGGGFSLPYTFDPSALGDGALPSPWSGSTFTISGGIVVNSPTLVTEKLSDTGLEATYTGGLCGTLTKAGSPNVSESADVHGGSKAQQFQAVAAGNSVYPAAFAGVAGQWYQGSVWAKRTAGTGGTCNVVTGQTGMLLSATGGSITNAAYAQLRISHLSVSTNNITFYLANEGGSSFDTIILDDMSFKTITASSLFSLLYGGQADVTAKVRTPGVYASWADDTHIGVVIRADATSNPNNFILGYIKRRQNGATLGVAGIIKCVNGTYSQVLGDTVVTLAANADIELRASGSTVQLFYNNAQVSTDKTISDAELLTNKNHGFFSAGGNSVNRFFLT